MKKIALINDLSGFGRCSLTAAIPVISVLGIQACPLPTAVLSAQTGFSSYYCDDFTDKMNYFTDEWAGMGVSFDGIYSGYLGSAAQMQNVLYFLDKFKKKNTIYIADPVMGDNGRCIRIFTQELLDCMKELTKHADVVTPNLTELCLLSDTDYDNLTSHNSENDYMKFVEEAACKLLKRADGAQTVIVTGVIRKAESRAFIGNVGINADGVFYLEEPYNGKSFSGTGDLFTSVIAGSMVKGELPQNAVKKAVKFLQPAIDEAAKADMPINHGVYFEKYLHLLL